MRHIPPHLMCVIPAPTCINSTNIYPIGQSLVSMTAAGTINPFLQQRAFMLAGCRLASGIAEYPVDVSQSEWAQAGSPRAVLLYQCLSSQLCPFPVDHLKQVQRSTAHDGLTLLIAPQNSLIDGSPLSNVL